MSAHVRQVPCFLCFHLRLMAHKQRTSIKKIPLFVIILAIHGRGLLSGHVSLSTPQFQKSWRGLARSAGRGGNGSDRGGIVKPGTKGGGIDLRLRPTIDQRYECIVILDRDTMYSL